MVSFASTSLTVFFFLPLLFGFFGEDSSGISLTSSFSSTGSSFSNFGRVRITSSSTVVSVTTVVFPLSNILLMM